MTGSDGDLPSTGSLTGGVHRLPVRVYFEDTDHSGFVYHASYLRFMERGRTEYVRALGISQTDMAKGTYGEPLVFVVHRIAIDFRRPAKFDDLLTVETMLVELGGARLRLRQTVRRGSEILTDAEVTIVLVTPEGRARRIPREICPRLLQQP